MASRTVVRAVAASLAVFVWWAHSALAHDGVPPEPHDIWGAWNWQAGILLTILALAYGRGLRTLWRRAGRGRGVRQWQAGAYAAGLTALAAALVSPLDALGLALFSAHMVQHLLLVVVAAPLLVLGRPLGLLLWALPTSTLRQRAGGWQRLAAIRLVWLVLTWPVVAWAVHAAVLWIWHVPGFYQAALDGPIIHLAEHASFIGTAVLFWWTVIHPASGGAAAYGVSAVAVFTMALQGGMLGALLTFGSTPWYRSYADTAPAWGMTPLHDQQLAGVMMWALAGFVYLAAALALVAAWLRAAERRHHDTARVPGRETVATADRRA